MGVDAGLVVRAQLPQHVRPQQLAQGGVRVVARAAPELVVVGHSDTPISSIATRSAFSA
ncbi:hypothetical protein [Microlunatus capsulatus]|uniref:hypothetical protein n=1 Tax=Microlunatus capsulatus TaxID=99117 RepID=UPI0031DF5BBD